METLYQDVFSLILRKLKYDDLVKFSLTSKKYIQIQNSVYYLEKKEKYHNPKEKFKIKGDNEYADNWDYKDIIYGKNKWLAYMWITIRKPNKYQIQIFADLFDVLDYTEFIFPFVFSDILLKRIKNRYNDFKITAIVYAHDCSCDLIFDNLMDNSISTNVLQQMNLLFHVLKNYKKEIVKEIYNQDEWLVVHYKENKIITSQCTYDINLSRKYFK